VKRLLLTFALAGMTGATLFAPALAHAATPATPAIPSSVVYESTPVKGTVSIPSEGPEAYSFNQIGNEVILRPHSAAIRHISVTMVSWACQNGSWDSGCSTTPGATFTTPITLDLYRYARTNQATGAFVPGKRILSVTRTFSIRYRPSAASATEKRFLGKDGEYHNGLDQTITFPVNQKLSNDVVWAVSYNTATSGPSPLGHASPTDSLNVGLAPKVRVGLNRTPDSIFWDTRYQGFTCADPANGNGPSSSFVTGVLNRDGACNGTPNSWHGYVPAASFSVS
jgi:hypothetical protein